MMNYELFSGWGFFLWLGFFFLVISSFGNWGYTYRTHKKYSGLFPNKALDILNERYASGEVNHDEYTKMKSALA